MTQKLSEKELELIFSDRRTRLRASKTFKVLKYFGSFALAAIIIFVVLNYPGISTIFRFWYNDQFKSADEQTPVVSQPNSDSATPEVKLPDIENNSIRIETLNVSAPILWNIPNTPDKVAEGLSKGVIHIDGTALPGQIGNVFITGHSSNYVWAKGNYNTVFALLDKLVIGDTVQIKYNNQNYLYEVFEKKIVTADDTSVLKSTTDSRLTLMTCYPVGTNLKRLIVIAKQKYPI